MSAEKVKPLAEVTVRAISEVKPSPGNVRKIPPRAVEVVAASLQRFGWKQPLVIDRDGFLVAGHTRLQAAQQLKLKQVPVIVADDLTEDEVRAYRIADNRTHDFSTWDYPALVVELDGLAADFSDVLALQDWQAIAEEFDAALDLEPEIVADMQGTGFEVTIVFADKDAALAAEPGLMDLPGALDVRHKLRVKPPEEREGYIERLQKQEQAAGQ